MHSQNFKNGKHKFPVSTESLELLQQQIYMTARLASLAGTNVIVKNPTSSSVPSASAQLLTFDNQFSPFSGLVIINGQLYPLYGNSAKSRIAVIESSESVQVPGETDPLQVRTFRYAQYVDSGGYAVSGFTTLDNIVTLMSRINTIEGAYMSETDIRALVTATQNTLQATITATNTNLTALTTRVQTIENNYKTAAQINDLLAANAQHHLPKCSVIDWYCSGYISFDKVPTGFVPCGKVIIGKSTDFSASTLSNELNKWKNAYGNNVTSGSITKNSTQYTYLQITKANNIDVPDLTDRFVIQGGYTYDKWSHGGVDGGSVTLELKNMPSHKHDVSVNQNGSGHQHRLAWPANSGGSSSLSASYYVDEQGQGSSGNETYLYTYDSSNGGKHSHGVSETNKGSGEAFSVMPPYFALYKLIKVI